MPTIKFYINSKRQTKVRRIDNEILWYDFPYRDNKGNFIPGKMNKFTGGKLSLTYNSDNNKFDTSVEKITYKEDVYEKNDKEIKKWIKDNEYLYDLYPFGDGLTVSFPEKYRSEIIRSMDEFGFEYEIKNA